MGKALTSTVLACLLVLGFLMPQVANADTVQRDGGIFYESRPDEVALYLSDIAFVRDTVVLPTGQETQILLPPGTYPNTLIFSEDGRRVHNYRIRAQAVQSTSAVYQGGGTAYVITWESESTGADTREIKLEYLLPGASWTPTYDMQIIDNGSVALAFFAEIHNSALILDETTVYLVAGRVDLSQQVDQQSMVTMNQYAAGYSNEEVALPDLGVGSLDMQHVYAAGAITANPGDVIYRNLADATLAARRLLVWNTAKPQADVIFKVMNDTDVPLAEGIVRTYQDNLFTGSDFIERTPIGSEGSVTAGNLPDLRVHRTESQEYMNVLGNDFYQHAVTLEINNYGDEDLDLRVLDPWKKEAFEFEFSQEPQRDPDNLLRWDITIPAGESITITYSFKTDY